jgi:hypothetical protein
MAVSGVALTQREWLAAVFYHFGHLTPYAYVQITFVHQIDLIKVLGRFWEDPLEVFEVQRIDLFQESISWGIHELPKVSLGPAMPYH